MVAERIGPIEPDSDAARLVLRAVDHAVELTIGDQAFRITWINDTGSPAGDPEKQLAAIHNLANLLKNSPTFDAEGLKSEIRQYRDDASEGRFGDE
ncbi:MAG: hypothetical protein IT334_06065 [Thermomicrobiales bacterium]|nr:hypothetical protein [Thermomicrobiales bacterium]